MSKKNFEPLNEISGRLFFLVVKTGSSDVLWTNIVNPERPQFSLKLYHSPFCISPSGPSEGLSISTSHPRARASLTLHLRGNNNEKEQAQSQEEKRITSLSRSYYVLILF